MLQTGVRLAVAQGDTIDAGLLGDVMRGGLENKKKAQKRKEREARAWAVAFAGVALVAVDDLVSYHAQMKSERMVGAAFGAELSVVPELVTFDSSVENSNGLNHTSNDENYPNEEIESLLITPFMEINIPF